MGLQFPLSKGRQHNQPTMKTIATVALCAVGAQAQWSWTSGGIPIPGSPGLVLNPLSQAVDPENSPQWHLEALRGQGLEVSVNGAITPKQTPEWEAAAARNAAAPVVKREAEPWYGWRGYSGAPIAGGALVIGQNSVTPDYTPAQKGAAWGLNWGLVKRDADPEVDAYYGYGGYGLGYGLGYGGYGYGGLGYGYGKRSADSEADAYYGYGGYGLGYGGYGYGGLGYGYGKRSADSEADAYYGYGGYGGYGLGYGYGG